MTPRISRSSRLRRLSNIAKNLPKQGSQPKIQQRYNKNPFGHASTGAVSRVAPSHKAPSSCFWVRAPFLTGRGWYSCGASPDSDFRLRNSRSGRGRDGARPLSFREGEFKAGGVSVKLFRVLYDTGALHKSYISAEIVDQHREEWSPFIFSHRAVACLADQTTTRLRRRKSSGVRFPSLVRME